MNFTNNTTFGEVKDTEEISKPQETRKASEHSEISKPSEIDKYISLDVAPQCQESTGGACPVALDHRDS